MNTKREQASYLALENNFLEFYCGENSHADIDVHDYLGGAYNFGRYFYYIFNSTSQRFEYIDPKVNDVLGMREDELNPEYFKKNMHPSDLETYLEMEKITAQFLLYGDPELKHQYKLRYDCRIRSANDNYIRVLHQIIPVKIASVNEPFRIFGIFTDISHLKLDGKMSFTLIGLNGAPTYYGIQSLKNRVSTENVLSTREIQILLMLSEDMISKEIAQKLFISTQTVANHRKNMLRKTKSKSTTELLMKAIRNGWI